MIRAKDGVIDNSPQPFVIPLHSSVLLFSAPNAALGGKEGEGRKTSFRPACFFPPPRTGKRWRTHTQTETKESNAATRTRGSVHGLITSRCDSHSAATACASAAFGSVNTRFMGVLSSRLSSTTAVEPSGIPCTLTAFQKTRVKLFLSGHGKKTNEHSKS